MATTTRTSYNQTRPTKRSRTGCWTCRRRHQKCDETKPGCLNCQLRGAECGGYGIRLTDFIACDKGPDQRMRSVWRTQNRDSAGQQVKRSRKTEPSKCVNQDTDACETGPRTPRTELFTSESIVRHDSSTISNLPFQNASLKSTLASDFDLSRRQGTCVPKSITRSPHDRPDSIQCPGNSTTASRNPYISSTESITNWLGNQSETRDDPADALYEHIYEGSKWIEPTGSYDLNMTDIDGDDHLTQDVLEQQLLFSGDTWCNQDSNLVVVNSNNTADVMNIEHRNEVLTLAKPMSSFETHLLHHFLYDVAPRLQPVVELGRNPYKTIYGQMGKQSLPLRNAIMFASALHLTKMGHLPNEVLKTHRIALRTSFRDALLKPEEAWSLGLTVLLSVVLDVIGTGMDSWSMKLIGCRRLLELGLSSTKPQMQAEVNCIRMQYNWMSNMGRSLLLGTQASHLVEELVPIGGVSYQMEDLNDLAVQQSHWWANQPDYAMYTLLREAVDLASAVHAFKTGKDRWVSVLQLMPQVAELVEKIRQWQPEAASVISGFQTDEAHFNNIWRQGLLCFVYHEIYWMNSSDPRIQECVKRSLVSFEQLSWLQACLWPTFMIAVHALDSEARQCYERRLREMHTTLQFTAPLSIALVLKQIWDTVDEDSSGQTRWKQVAESLDMELNILL